MVEEGVLENPRPDYSLSLHLWNEKPSRMDWRHIWASYGSIRNLFRHSHWKRRAWRCPTFDD